MNIERKYSAKKIFARVTLLIIPAIVIGTYMLWHLNEYYGAFLQAVSSIVFASGLLLPRSPYC